MYTVDASVWVNGFDQREARHVDGEHLTRLPAVMGVLTPAAALAALSANPNA